MFVEIVGCIRIGFGACFCPFAKTVTEHSDVQGVGYTEATENFIRKSLKDENTELTLERTTADTAAPREKRGDQLSIV